MTKRALLLLLTALLAAPALAQDDPTIPDSTAFDPAPAGTAGGRPVEVQVRTLGAYYSNFTQVPSGVPRENVLAGTADALVAVPLGAGAPLDAYGRASTTAYDGFDPSFGLTAGLRGGSGPHRGDVQAGYLWRTPRYEVGEEFGFADVLHLGASYGARVAPAVELSLGGDYWNESYGTLDTKDNAAFDLAAAARYRGFGRLFSPEVGVAVGGRNVVDDAEDYGQRTAWVSVRSVPAPPVYLQLRYRNRVRSYDTEDPTASNFEREDTRHQITLSTDVRVWRNLSWVAYYAWERSNSTRESRRFTSAFFTTGVSLRL